jgi:phosphoenolpyruvate---glycerone phosphotransferase subunit DhaL
MRKFNSKAELAKMFAKAAALIGEHAEKLSQLDSVGGDGDHGTTMVRSMRELEAAINPQGVKSPSTMLKEAGWSVMNVDGGASSALLGTFVAGMGDSEIGEELDCQSFAHSLQAGLRAVLGRTKARMGDKTMVDALVPAVDAFHAAASSGKTIVVAMREAAIAADAGAESTKSMIARYGRARNLGERTRGHMDPGAASIALLFRGFIEAFATETEGVPSTAIGRSGIAKSSES